MAHPLIRAPARQLLDARQDHARCLRLAAWYRRQLSTGDASMRDRHAWALGHTVLREVVGVGRETSAFYAPGPADLIAAAGLSLEALPVIDLCSIFDAADTLSAVAAALTCQPRQMAKEGFNGAGRLIENTAFALHAVMEAAAKELRGRTLTDASEQERRAVTLARLTIDNGDTDQTAAFARELLAMVER